MVPVSASTGASMEIGVPTKLRPYGFKQYYPSIIFNHTEVKEESVWRLVDKTNCARDETLNGANAE